MVLDTGKASGKVLMIMKTHPYKSQHTSEQNSEVDGLHFYV